MNESLNNDQQHDDFLLKAKERYDNPQLITNIEVPLDNPFDLNVKRDPPKLPDELYLTALNDEGEDR